MSLRKSGVPLWLSRFMVCFLSYLGRAHYHFYPSLYLKLKGMAGPSKRRRLLLSPAFSSVVLLYPGYIDPTIFAGDYCIPPVFILLLAIASDLRGVHLVLLFYGSVLI